MTVGAVNGLGGYSTYFQGINPRKDKVYIDPKTGEYTTWKPGIIMPEKPKKKHTALKLALLAGLAFIFRGKIKQGYQLLKPVIAKVTTPVKTFLKTKAPAVYTALKGAKGAVVKVGTKVVGAVTGVVSKAWQAVKGIFSKVKP